MTIKLRWVHWSMVFVLQAGCSYQATVPCDGCAGTQTKTIIGDAACEKGLAQLNAWEDCEALGGAPRESETTFKQFVNLECFFSGSVHAARLAAPATRLLKSTFPAFTPSAPVAAEATDAFNCGFAFNIIAINSRHEDEYPCRDVRKVRVGYSRINPQTQAVEDVFEDKTVEWGNQASFACTDVYATRDDGTPDPNGTANFVYVIFEGFREEAQSKCVRVPLDQGGMSRSLNGQIRNGGEVQITLNPVGAGSTFNVVITNPLRTRTPVARTPDLMPIPDPLFANGR